ncbi:ankyrin repeat domain-containing protein 45 [Centropristis striata]|uniref:ankyrin repeat domain-containing protein 45 n=1 Tax=Centropristis striata TaxID=184440 RepID=UPI0027E114A0|nr:ankyrin repeat domain-containing protein 45 [Centropristis striata]
MEQLGAPAEPEGDEDPGVMKDLAGREPLLTASMLGRSSAVRDLIRSGAPVNQQTARGYSSLHLAACWGHVDTVRTLLELGADPETRTFRGDRPVDLARSYCRTECTECLLVAEAKEELVSCLASVRDLISDPERNLSKEQKNVCTRLCSTKSDWIQSVRRPTVSDFRSQVKDLEDSLQPILGTLPAPGHHLE